MSNIFAGGLANVVFERTLNTLLKPNVPVQNHNAEVVANQVTKAIAPVIANATNSEPLYQSRVLAGQVAVYLGAILGLVKLYADGNFDPTLITADIGILLGGAVTIYGRIRGAKLKPLGQ